MPRIILRLFTTSKGLPSIRYNMEKVNRGQAELIHSANLGLLGLLSKPYISDYEHYFTALAALNPRSHFDQFHAVLSTRGKASSKQELLGYGKAWLEQMGYAKQPQLIFFHSDTENSHIHIVSTDVRLDRSKIADSFDRQRGLKILNSIMGIDEKKEFNERVLPLFDYRFSSIAQIGIILKEKGYRFFLSEDKYLIRKYGITFARIDADKLTQSLANASADHSRIAELRSLLSSALKIHSTQPEPVFKKLSGKSRAIINGYRSDLADFLKRAANVEISYQSQKGMLTAYTLIDHSTRQLIEGNQVMALNELSPGIQAQGAVEKKLKR